MEDQEQKDILEEKHQMRLKRRQQKRFLRDVILLFSALLIFAAIGLISAVSRQIHISNVTPTPRPWVTLPPTNTPLPTFTPTPTPTPGPVVIIDAGHGGSDPGSTSALTDEKHINLAIALKTKDLLKERGFTVIMSREEDVHLSPSERLRLSNDSDAVAFVSIHLNAGPSGDTQSHGIETLFYSGNNPLSSDLAEAIQTAVVKATGEKDRGTVQTGAFEVLYSNKPACILECGFISSTAEYELLISEEYQQKLADGITNGLVKFCNKITNDLTERN